MTKFSPFLVALLYEKAESWHILRRLQNSTYQYGGRSLIVNAAIRKISCSFKIGNLRDGE